MRRHAQNEATTHNLLGDTMPLRGSLTGRVGLNASVHDDRKLPALTSIRFFAAATVLVSHFAQRGLLGAPDEVVRFLDGGRTAVSLFFVLSGFILAYNYMGLDGGRDRRNYYAARIARIFPVVALSLLIGSISVVYAYIHRSDGLLLEWFSLDSNEEVFLGASFLAQLTMTTGWLPSASLNQPWNSPAWSITCEMFFYLLFPLIIVWVRKNSWRRIAAALVVIAVAEAVYIFFVAPLAPIGQRGFLVSQFPLAHMLEFLLGVATGKLFLGGGREWLCQGYRRSWLIVGSLAGILAMSFFQPVTPVFFAMTPLFAILVLALAVVPRSGRSWLSAPTLLLLGEASFSLYLIHVPLIHLYKMLAFPAELGWALLIAAVGLSILVFKTFESPARRLVRSILAGWVARGQSNDFAVAPGRHLDKQ